MKKQHPIAIVGIGGIFPGANTLDIFWQNLIDKVDAAGPVPPERWIAPIAAMYNSTSLPDKALSKRACLIENFKFDMSSNGASSVLINELNISG